MKLRTVTAAQRQLLAEADQHAKRAVLALRAAGATNAANAIARARKSVGGAIRHADRCPQ